jgi:hypothetical protein
MPGQSQGTRVPHDRVHHLSCPLGPECWLTCLGYFGLSWDCRRALQLALGVNCTIGELTGRYSADFTQIRGIGPSRSGELARVLRAGRFEQGMTEVAVLREVLAYVRSELDEDGRIGQALVKGLDMTADLARMQCLRKIEDATRPVTDQVAGDRVE